MATPHITVPSAKLRISESISNIELILGLLAFRPNLYYIKENFPPILRYNRQISSDDRRYLPSVSCSRIS